MLSSNYSNNVQTEVGGLVFLATYSAKYIPYLSIYALGIIFGCTGNIMIMGAVLTAKELHSSTNWLIFNLAIADLYVCGFIGSQTIISAFIGKKFFADKFQLCQFIASTCIGSCAVSMVNIWLLALNRYINICYHRYYAKIFSKCNTVVFCLLAWIVGFLVDLPNFLGWGGHRFSDNTLTCLWDRHVNHGYNIFFPTTTVIIPCISILYWYIRIFLFSQRSSKNVMNNKQKSQRSFRIAKGLFGSYILFFLCWVPYAIVIMTDVHYTYPAELEIYTLLLAHLNSTLNPIFYAIYNHSFRIGYKKFLYKLVGKTYVSTSETNIKINGVFSIEKPMQNTKSHSAFDTK